MYRDLGEIVRGWSKNVALGSLQTVPPWMRPAVLPGALMFGVTVWILPPVALLVALVGVGGAGLLTWAVAAVSVSVVFWCVATARMGAPFVYGLLYPLGASVGAWIVLRSWLRGRQVEWKGRQYHVERPS
jgi:hypothetical protein